MPEHERLLKEAIDSLGAAAEAETSIRFGHDVARVLHAALLDASTEKAHRHAWQPLGFLGGTPPVVVQSCACGSAQSVNAEQAS